MTVNLTDTTHEVRLTWCHYRQKLIKSSYTLAYKY